MLIKLTNSNVELQGMPIYLMSEHIVSVFEVPTEGGSLQTAVYGLRGDTWYVEEGLNEAVNIINGKKK